LQAYLIIIIEEKYKTTCDLWFCQCIIFKSRAAAFPVFVVALFMHSSAHSTNWIRQTTRFWGTTTSGFLAATAVHGRTTVSVRCESFHAVVTVCNSYVFVTKPTGMWLNTAMGPFVNREWQLLLSENLFHNTDMQTTNCLNECFLALAFSGQWMTHYTVSQKTCHYTYRHNLGKCWQIFKILSDLDSALNLQYVFRWHIKQPFKWAHVEVSFMVL